MKEILDVIHKTIYQFFDVCGDDEEVPMSDKDKLLLEVNKAICNNLKVLEPEPEWIPVSERMPKENETVLINYCRLNERSVRMAIWDELHCRFYNSEYTKYVSVDFVTAWMPLPKPYEPQERSDKE